MTTNVQQGNTIWFWMPTFNPKTNESAYQFQTGYVEEVDRDLNVRVVHDASTEYGNWIPNELIIKIF